MKEINRKGWTKISFGEVCKNLNHIESDPLSKGIERYIGLEHIESGNLHIKAWGSVAEGTTFTKKFTKGNILFGKRRAYLKKAAIADFDGICSGDILVLEANENRIHKDLLPFLVSSELFFDHAVQTSAGSLSPRTKFQDLAKFEFLLPPKEQQTKLAELLWAGDELVEKYNKMKLEIDKTQQALIDSEYENPKNKLEIVKIKDLENALAITEIQDGNHGELHPKSSDYANNGIPFIMANSFLNGEIDVENCKRLPKIVTDKLRIGFAKKGDVLLTHKATIGETAIITTLRDSPYFMLTPQVTYYRVDRDKLLNTFLLYSFRTSSFRNQILSLSAQSTRAYIGITAQRELKIPFTKNLDIQKSITDKIVNNRSKVTELDNNLATMKQIQKQLINQIFSPQ